MKSNISKSFLFCFLFTAFAFSQSIGVIQSVINDVKKDSLMFFVKELSGVVQTTINGQPYTIVSRHKNNSSNDKAGEYIKQKFENYGLNTQFNIFSTTGKNIIGIKTGVKYPNKKYIICAHFDDMPSGSLAPGSDDNGSGTAAVIEAARIFSQYPSDYTIIFAAWDEEEQGLIGSNYYANQAYALGDSILGVINLDMIAYDSNNDGKCRIHTKNLGISTLMADKMMDFNSTYSIGLNPTIKNPGITASDHASFWNKNYSAILLIEDDLNDFNAYYHTINDKIDYFNIPYFEKLTKLALATLAYYTLDLTIPVELVSFNSKVEQNSVMLTWITATETNNKGFEIQRSTSQLQFADKSWETLSFINGMGSTTEKQNYFYADKNLSSGKYFYRLKQIDFDGTIKYSNTLEVEIDLQTQFKLYQNYPNPFSAQKGYGYSSNPSTEIAFYLPSNSSVTLKIYDLLGKEIAALINNERREAGRHNYSLLINNYLFTSGIYFYELYAKSESETFFKRLKMLYLK